MTEQTLSSTFNYTVAENAVSAYKKISEHELVERTPVQEGGTLVRVYNFAADRNTVTGAYENAEGALKHVGTKDFANMDSKTLESAKAFFYK